MFLKSENSILVPLGNKINIYKLDFRKSYTLDLETKYNITKIALSSDEKILVCIDSKSYSVIFNLKNNYIISYFNFKGNVNNILFSKDSKLFAVLIENGIKIY